MLIKVLKIYVYLFLNFTFFILDDVYILKKGQMMKLLI